MAVALQWLGTLPSPSALRLVAMISNALQDILWGIISGHGCSSSDFMVSAPQGDDTAPTCEPVHQAVTHPPHPSIALVSLPIHTEFL